jgi:ribonuclease III family protein
MTLNSIIFPDDAKDPNLLSPLTLAFIGDTVFDLLVREKIIGEANRPVGKLHMLSAKRVCAGAQARAAECLAFILSEDELAVYKRGRNADSGHKPKNATEAQYHAATGLEALFGWLYLKGANDRIRELFAAVCEKQEPANI